MRTRQKKLRDGRLFTVYLERDHVEHIQHTARKMSLAEGRDISTCEAVRMAIELVYPYNPQTDMFPHYGKKRRLKRMINDAQMSFI